MVLKSKDQILKLFMNSFLIKTIKVNDVIMYLLVLERRKGPYGKQGMKFCLFQWATLFFF